jgi:hypothetical protein
VGLHLQKQGWKPDGSVFEWLVTPWDAVMQVFADEGARLGERFFACANGSGAACAEYGLVYWHEFPRTPDGFIEFSAAAIEACRGKMRRKMRGLLAVCDTARAVLFIRRGAATTLPWDRFATGARFGSAELNAFIALVEARFPRLLFSLLFIEIEGEKLAELAEPLDLRVTHVILPAEGPADAAGKMLASDDAWHRLFSEIPYRPASPRAAVAGGQ